MHWDIKMVKAEMNELSKSCARMTGVLTRVKEHKNKNTDFIQAYSHATGRQASGAIWPQLIFPLYLPRLLFVCFSFTSYFYLLTSLSVF